MTEASQLVLGVIALCIVVLAPIGLVLFYEGVAAGWGGIAQRWRRSWSDRLERRRNLQILRNQRGVPLEQLAVDLRRLRTSITTGTQRSAAQQLGTRIAYDRVLTQVCAMLDIQHDLADEELTGLDRDIERVRVEAELEGAGVALTNRRYGQAA